MANNSLDDRLAALYQKRDHIDQFYDADLKTVIDAIRDAREHGGTASVDITPISGGGGYTITITDSEGTEHTATVKDGGDAYEVYKSTVPSGETPMSKTEWLASLKGANGADGAQGHNPCLGRFNVLPTLSPNPFADARKGDYIYFDTTDQQTSDPVTYIYYFDGTDWDTTGTLVDVSNLSFSTGQDVVGVAIKDIDGEADSDAQGVLSAEAGSVLAENVFNYEEIDLSVYTPQGWAISSNQKWTNLAGTSVMVPVSAGEVYVIKKTGTGSAFIGILASAVWPTELGETVSFATGFTSRIVINNTTEVVTIPEDGVALCVRMNDSKSVSTVPDEILKKGGTLLDKRIEEIKGLGSQTVKMAKEIPLSEYQKMDWIIGPEGKWLSGSGKSVMVGVIPNKKYIVIPINGASTVSVLKRDVTPYVQNQNVNFSDSYNSRIYIDSPYEIVMPDDGYYLNVRLTLTDSSDVTPRVLLIDESIGGEIETIQHAATSEQIVDFMQYRINGRLGTDSLEYLDIGTSFCIPVGEADVIKEGDTVNMICKVYTASITPAPGATPVTVYETSKIYLTFLKEAPVIGQNVVLADNVTHHILTDSTVGNSVVVPKGTAYILLLEKTSSTSATTHEPVQITRMVGGIDSDKLVKGTFNSSYNEVDTSAIEDEFCGYMLGKNNIETFLFFTDPHLAPNSRYEEMNELVRDKYISALQKYYNSLPLDTIICGGDLLNYHDTKREAIASLGYADAYMRKLFKHYYPVMGNHDMNPYKQTGRDYSIGTALSMTEVRNTMFRENGSTYYSFDGLKTKFYILDSGVSFDKRMVVNSSNHYDRTTNPIGDYSGLITPRWEQVAWLAGKLTEDDADCSVIAMHIYSNGIESDWFSDDTGLAARGIHELGHNVKLLAEAYNNRGQITLNGVTYDFTSTTGHVMFMICGHTHVDYVDCSGDLPVIAVTDIEGRYFDGTGLSYALVPTFDCCMLDIDNSVLYMTRVGVKNSRIVNCEKVSVAVGSTTALTSKLTGTLTWSVQARYSSVVSVSVGVVTGISAGYAGVVATDEDGREEYFIVQCS